MDPSLRGKSLRFQVTYRANNDIMIRLARGNGSEIETGISGKYQMVDDKIETLIIFSVGTSS